MSRISLFALTFALCLSGRRKTRNPFPIVHFSYCVQCPTTLNETEFRQFWISWKDGIISYGNGSEPGLNIIGVYSDPSPIAVNYMSIASQAGVVADWIIPGHLFNASAGKTVAYTYEVEE